VVGAQPQVRPGHELVGGIDPSSSDNINPHQCMSIFLDLATRSQQLKEMPTLDDIDIKVWQMGDQSRGMQIPRADAIGGQKGVSASSGSGKGKQQVPVSRPTIRVGS
jgi:hypothetical protein